MDLFLRHLCEHLRMAAGTLVFAVPSQVLGMAALFIFPRIADGYVIPSQRPMVNRTAHE